jgi:hypothetical protein
MAPGISTTPTTTVNIGYEDEANAAAARDALANAPRGFEAIGFRDALDMYDQGKISLNEAIGYGLHNALGFPGTQIGFSVDPRTQEQTPAMDISIPGMAFGALGMISGVPGLGMVGARAGTAIGEAFGIPSVTVDYSPGQFGAPAPDTNSGFDYINPNINQRFAALNQMYGEQLSGAPAYATWDWAKIQSDAAANNQTLDQYLARNLGNLSTNAPRLMKHGGMVGGKKSLEELHRRYAEGGEVGGEGMVRPYDPREVDTIASEFMRGISPGAIAQLPGIMYPAIDRRRAF